MTRDKQIPAIGKIVRGSKDHKGRIRKWIEIKEAWYDDYDFGDMVVITKKKATQKS